MVIRYVPIEVELIYGVAETMTMVQVRRYTNSILVSDEVFETFLSPVGLRCVWIKISSAIQPIFLCYLGENPIFFSFDWISASMPCDQ